jgi:glucosamine--fructose-6-phosphate aminotransferase (isomerizing)
MCGIVGYVGKQSSLPILLEGLRALEYIGYDSAGVAFLSSDRKSIKDIKRVGAVSELMKAVEKTKDISGTIGIAHTRWATHGEPTLENTHPHCDEKRKVFVVHNGIIENYRELKERLKEKGYKFKSETDTEVVAHLISSFLKKGDSYKNSLLKSLSLIEGTYGLVVMYSDNPKTLYVARKSSPLVLGVGDGENFIASDPSALIGKTRKVIYLKENEVAEVNEKEIKVTNIFDEPVKYEVTRLEWDLEEVRKGDFEHFMLKEIYEGSEVVRSACRGRLRVKDGKVKLGGLEDVAERLDSISKIIIVSCGTSFYAGMIGKYLFEEISGISVEVEQASEFRYREGPLDPDSVFLAISQSGETADTLAALQKAKDKGLLTLGIVNMVGSSIARETDAGVYNHAGPEIGVASTKAYLSQITILTLMALFKSDTKSRFSYRALLRELDSVPNLIAEILTKADQIKALAEKYKKYENFLFVGRRYGYPVALEGALKLKEISYIHAEGYSAGEMKHGPIALVDESFPTVAITLNNEMFGKMTSNVEEIKARKGPVIAIATEDDRRVESLVDDVFYIPSISEPLEPLLAVVPLQLFAYYMGVGRGINVDRPKNLAKSVTVE